MRRSSRRQLADHALLSSSGDDVGVERILDARDLILEAQLALLQPAQGKLIRPRRLGKRRDGIIQGTMLLPQLVKPGAKALFLVHEIHSVSLHPPARCETPLYTKRISLGKPFAYWSVHPFVLPPQLDASKSRVCGNAF